MELLPLARNVGSVTSGKKSSIELVEAVLRSLYVLHPLVDVVRPVVV